MWPVRVKQRSRNRPGRSPRSTSTASRTSTALPTSSPSGWFMSVTRAAVAAPGGPAEVDAGLASSTASAVSCMNAPEPALTSSRMLAAPPASFLLITLEAIRATLPTVAGHVAEGIDRLVGRDQVGGLGGHGQPDPLHLVEQLAGAEADPEAGDRLQLVERPAGVAEAAPGQLDHLHAEGGGERAHDQGGAVGHAAGGVLVDRRPAEPGQVEPVAGGDHGLGQGLGLGPGEPAQVPGHQERRHLVVGQLLAGVGEHEVAQLAGRRSPRRPACGRSGRPPAPPAHRRAAARGHLVRRLTRGASAPSRSSSERTWARASRTMRPRSTATPCSRRSRRRAFSRSISSSAVQ